ncbi:MAG: tannase/feruloyl esterase family alpha/beta hydrolase, partial [Comamonadaceae bacterium]
AGGSMKDSADSPYTPPVAPMVGASRSMSKPSAKGRPCARGAGSASPNPEVPAAWSPTRSRPLCAWPAVARYRGGDPEQAASFVCSRS